MASVRFFVGARDQSPIADTPPGLVPYPVRNAVAVAFPDTGLDTMGKANPFVVVVDDDESVSRAIKRLLRSIGMNADTFASGDEFLDTLSSMPSYRPECVILDVQMPGLNGLEVQRRLTGSGLPVIFITAHDDIGVREQALAGGAVAYLRKPFNDELFVKTVRAAIGKR
jgi:FixJ family two-component response regulator